MKIKVLFAVLVLLTVAITSCDDSVAPPSEDTEAPSVRITQPTDLAQIQEPVTIVVSASDNSAIARVAFFIDGGFIGEDIASPYELEWDPGYRAQGGDHVLTAEAEDAAGNVGSSAPINVTVSFSAGPDLNTPADEVGFPDSDAIDLSWSSVAGASEYRVQVSDRLDFGTTAMDEVLSTPAATTPNLLDGWHFWRVRARGSDELWSGWSDVRVFLVGGSPTTVPTFSSTYGSYMYEEAYEVKETADGGFVVAGRQDDDLWLLKVDAQGEEMWNEPHTGLNFFLYQDEYTLVRNDPMLSLDVCDDGGYLICGAGDDGGFHQRRYDPLGQESWRQVVGDSLTDPAEGWAAMQTPDGGNVAVGMVTWNAGIYTYGGIGVVRTDQWGKIIWTHTEDRHSDSELGLFDSGRSLDVIDSDSFIITGSDHTAGNHADLLLMQVTDIGDTAVTDWAVSFDVGNWGDHGNCVKVTGDGGFIVCGYSLNPSDLLGPDADVLVIKTDAAGAEEWSYTFAGPSEDYGQSVVLTDDGGYLIVGQTNSPYDDRSLPAANLLMIKLDSDGNEEWVENFGLVNGGETGFSIDNTSDGGFIVCGSTYTNGGDSDFWLIKLDEEGNIGGNTPPEH